MCSPFCRCLFALFAASFDAGERIDFLGGFVVLVIGFAFEFSMSKNDLLALRPFSCPFARAVCGYKHDRTSQPANQSLDAE